MPQHTRNLSSLFEFNRIIDRVMEKRGCTPFHASIHVSRRVLSLRTTLILTATFLANHKIAADSSKQLGDYILHVIWQV